MRTSTSLLLLQRFSPALGFVLSFLLLSAPSTVHGDVQLNVASTGVSGVTITSTSGHGGVTDYIIYGISESTVVSLQAPLTSGGKQFIRWQGCQSNSGERGSTCTIKMDYNWSVQADYVDGYLLTVTSLGASNVPISSTTGHSGITDYVVEVSRGSDVRLKPPLHAGGRYFSHWSANCFTQESSYCDLLNVTANTTITAHYYASSPADDFVTTWRTDNPGTSGDTSVTVPIQGGLRYMVDWDNNGSFDEYILAGYASHDYGSIGTYTLRIKGSYDSIKFYNAGDREKILSVDQWGSNAWTTMEGAFHGATNLIFTATDTPNFSSVERMSSMFWGAKNANPDTSNWDTSSVIGMEYMFYQASSANPNTSNWNTSSVLFMSRMFLQAVVADPDTSNWDTSSVVFMNSMFEKADNATPDTSNWDTSSVRSMSRMFYGADKANPDTSAWNTSSVTDFSYAFFHAAKANPDTSNWDTSSVTDMSHMFTQAVAANPDTGNWDTSAVTDMSGMFAEASIANPNTSNWNTSSVTDMGAMFSRAPAANPDTAGWDTSSVKNMAWMFRDATAFDRDVSSWDVTALTDAGAMFLGITLSTVNYENLLIGWGAQALKPGVVFNGGNSTYCSPAATEARSHMINSHGWSIYDGGQVCPPEGRTVFVPIEPCRILDTRVVGGHFGGGVTRSYRVLGDGLDLQGGSYDCAVPADAVSVQLNFTAVGSTGFGYLRAWPYDLAEPTATLMAFTEGPGISNSVALAICNTCVSDFFIKIYGAATHLAVEVLGYYREFVAPK